MRRELSWTDTIRDIYILERTTSSATSILLTAFVRMAPGNFDYFDVVVLLIGI